MWSCDFIGPTLHPAVPPLKNKKGSKKESSTEKATKFKEKHSEHLVNRNYLPLRRQLPSGKYMQRDLFFHCGRFPQRKKKKKMLLSSILPVTLPSSPTIACCLTVDLSKPLVVVTEGLMVSVRPAKPWRRMRNSWFPSACDSSSVWARLCPCAMVAADPCSGVRGAARAPKSRLYSLSSTPLLLLLNTCGWRRI